jgi:hypothetical protein
MGVDVERIVATDVLRWQAYRAALAAWADQAGRAPVEIPQQRRPIEDGPMRPYIPR